MRRIGWPLAAAIGIGLTSAAMAQTGGFPAQPPPLVKMAQHWQTILGSRARFLSGPARGFVNLGATWHALRTASALVSGGSGAGGGLGMSATGQATQISGRNLNLTRFFGTTQSETSTAWCGRHAVVGFNDSGSILEDDGGKGLYAFFGLTTPTTGFSYAGYAVSTNAGQSNPTFSDKLQPPTGPVGSLNEGDPAVVCSNASNFWLSNVYVDASQAGPSGCGYQEITVQASTDGGSSFGAPQAAASYDGCYYLLDKDWMAISPIDPSELAISYTNFNDGNFGPYANDCGAAGAKVFEIDQEVVVSTDGGATWSTPTVVHFDCTGQTNAFNQFSQIAFDPNGNIFDAWEEFSSNYFTRSILIAKSTDNGASFGSPVKVASVDPVGDSYVLFGLQGDIRDYEAPSLSIGNPWGPNPGQIFIAWNDGNRRRPDQWMKILKGCCGYGDGDYGFANVLVTSSTDDGATWSTPVQVNSTIASPTDHFQPSIASEYSGNVGVCWYDRNTSSLNYQMTRQCSVSTDNGATWSVAVNLQSGVSVVNQDTFLIAQNYLGDYDTLVPDFTNTYSGFLGAFHSTLDGDQSVEVTRVSP